MLAFTLRYKYGKIVIFYSLSNAFDLISGSKFRENIVQIFFGEMGHHHHCRVASYLATLCGTTQLLRSSGTLKIVMTRCSTRQQWKSKNSNDTM